MTATRLETLPSKAYKPGARQRCDSVAARAWRGAMIQIRPFEADDLEALYAIALATGLSGEDASHLYQDPRRVGHIYAAPYALLSPECAFVAEDEGGVAGYIVGAVDTPAFEALLETRWWPTLRPHHPDPSPKPREAWTADELRCWQIHHPYPTPARIAEPYPSHLHINLLPRLQGRGIGRGLMTTWLDRVRALGSRGAHLGVGATNPRALRFYRAYGWIEPVLERPPPRTAVWMAMPL